MSRLTAVFAVLALSSLVFTGAAYSGGASPGLLHGTTGITTPNQPYRFVTLPGPTTTVLAAINKASGGVTRWRTLSGDWGIPLVTFDGAAEGLTRDGKTLVISDWIQPNNSPLRPSSTFRVYDSQKLTKRSQFTLKGDFSFDALSPDGRTLFLIEHVSEQDALKYLVRAYDLRAGRLLPQVIADREQKGWVMRGLPAKRLATPDGRWVYTLYHQDGGTPFVHALDAVTKTAHCIGIPWTGKQDPLWRAVLGLQGGKLTIAAGGRHFAIDRKTFALSLPRSSGGSGGVSAGAIAGIAAGGTALLAIAAFVALRRLRKRPGAVGLPA
jgi:hypothetical protein